MIVHPPCSWMYVRPGEVVLIEGVPRLVIANGPVYPTFPEQERVVLVEGIGPLTGVDGLSRAHPVTLDDGDAVANLAAAGLNPEVINVSIEE